MHGTGQLLLCSAPRAEASCHSSWRDLAALALLRSSISSLASEGSALPASASGETLAIVTGTTLLALTAHLLENNGKGFGIRSMRPIPALRGRVLSFGSEIHVVELRRRHDVGLVEALRIENCHSDAYGQGCEDRYPSRRKNQYTTPHLPSCSNGVCLPFGSAWCIFLCRHPLGGHLRELCIETD